MTRKQQSVGKDGEERAASALRSVGIEMVEKIGTPVRLIPAKIPGTYLVIWGDKVSGDHRGILPANGRSVLAETKTILDRNLRWSDLREHQPGRLSLHVHNHGMSVLVWVHETGVYIMLWPVPGFGEGKSISPETAEQLDTEARDFIAHEVQHG